MGFCGTVGFCGVGQMIHSILMAVLGMPSVVKLLLGHYYNGHHITETWDGCITIRLMTVEQVTLSLQVPHFTLAKTFIYLYIRKYIYIYVLGVYIIGRAVYKRGISWDFP